MNDRFIVHMKSPESFQWLSGQSFTLAVVRYFKAGYFTMETVGDVNHATPPSPVLLYHARILSGHTMHHMQNSTIVSSGVQP